MFIHRSRLIGLILMSFLLGAVGGTVYDSFAVDTHGKKRERHSSHRLMDRLSGELDLTGEQKGRLEQILEESRHRMMELSRSMRPRYDQIKVETRDRIRELLSAEQN